MGPWFQLPRFAICIGLSSWISLSCLFETTSITQQLRIEIIITDHGNCLCRCVTVSWIALYMKAGLEGMTRRIAMVSTLKIWVTKYSCARVSYSRKWKWWWRHILKLSNLFEKMSSVNQIIYLFHKYTVDLFKHCPLLKRTYICLGACADIRYFKLIFVLFHSSKY